MDVLKTKPVSMKGKKVIRTFGVPRTTLSLCNGPPLWLRKRVVGCFVIVAIAALMVSQFSFRTMSSESGKIYVMSIPANQGASWQESPSKPLTDAVSTAWKRKKLRELSMFDNIHNVIPNATLENGTIVRTESQIPAIGLLEAMERKLITMVSGYFEVPGMPHHPADYYQLQIRTTIAWLQKYGGIKQVIFYHNLDLDTHPLRKPLVKSGMTLRKVNLTDLPGANVSASLKTLCLQAPKLDFKNNKCKYLYEQLNQSENFVDVLSIWFSKLPLVERAITENLFNSIYFAWIDCGIRYRIGHRIDKYKLSRNKVGTPKSGMRYGPKPTDKKQRQRTVDHRMGMVGGPGHKMMKLIKLHEAKLQDVLAENSPFCYDEEIVLAETLFDPVYSRTGNKLLYYFKP